MNAQTNLLRCLVLVAACSIARPSAADDPWWDPAYSHRLPVQARAAGVERSHKPVEVDVDFGSPPGPDARSLRLVEVDANGWVLDDSVPFQFEKATSGADSNRGTLVFILTGTTPADASRRYYAYGRADTPPLTAPSVPTEVSVTDGVTLHETMECFKVETRNATYLYGKKGAGFASIVDRDGHDWIAYRPSGRGAGEFRGLPKFGQPEKLFHCGYGFGQYTGPEGFRSRVTRRGPIRIRIESETADGKSSCAWDFYPTFATVTLRKIAIPSYWFLYEGVPGGSLEPDRDFVVRPGNRRTTAAEPWSDNVPWVYVGAGEVDRALFLANHQPHDKVDSYVAWPFKPEPDGSFQQMTVFGFGRKGYKELIEHIPDLTTLPARFSLGFLEGTSYPAASEAIESAFKDVEVLSGPVQHR